MDSEQEICERCGGTGIAVSYVVDHKLTGDWWPIRTERKTCPDCKGAGKNKTRRYSKMGYKWENVTGQMGIATTPRDDGIEITVYFKDSVGKKDMMLFTIDSEDVFPFAKRQAVHLKYEHSRRFAYLLKKPSGNLDELLDGAEFRISAPLAIPANNFSHLTDIVLERKIKAPDWEEITSQCKPLLVKSSHSDGFYIKLSYKGTPVALLGEHKASVTMANGTAGKFKVEKAKNAIISFHVFMKNKA